MQDANRPTLTFDEIDTSMDNLEAKYEFEAKKRKREAQKIAEAIALYKKKCADPYEDIAWHCVNCKKPAYKDSEIEMEDADYLKVTFVDDCETIREEDYEDQYGARWWCSDCTVDMPGVGRKVSDEDVGWVINLK